MEHFLVYPQNCICFILPRLKKMSGQMKQNWSFDMCYMLMLIFKKPPKEENEPSKIVINVF
jgi:hypothetical protein